jgi:hypothetical protein
VKRTTILSGVGRARIAFLAVALYKKISFYGDGLEREIKFSWFLLSAKVRLPGKGQKYNSVFHKIAILLFLN